MKTFRLQEMEEYIVQKGTVSMIDLRNKFNVSMNTVRQDVAILCKKGTLEKIYGGVASKQANSLVPFETRYQKALQKKRAICRRAASLIQDGDIIFIDSGTTAMHVVEFIDPAKKVFLLTYNLNAINAALPHENIEVISLPGKLDRRTNSFISADTVKIMEKYNIRVSFMAATGITINGAVTNSSLTEYDIKKATVQNANTNVLLADSSKFGKASLMTFATLADMDIVITDTEIGEEYLALCKEKNTKVEIVSPT